MAAKDITITLTIDCPTMYNTYPSGSGQVDAWDQVLTFSDDNNGALHGHIETFESSIYAGKKVTWQAQTASGNSNDFKVSIDKIAYEPQYSDDNVFSETTINGNNGKVTATVLPTAPVLPSGADNESYSIWFTVSPNPANSQRPPKQWKVDPKLKVDPST